MRSKTTLNLIKDQAKYDFNNEFKNAVSQFQFGDF